MLVCRGWSLSSRASSVARRAGCPRHAVWRPTARDAPVNIPDPYKTLQVDPEAEDEVIEAAYRRLARKYHPDVAPGPEAQDRMVRINQAWEMLRDPTRRAAVDRARARSAGTAARAAAAEARERATAQAHDRAAYAAHPAQQPDATDLRRVGPRCRAAAAARAPRRRGASRG